MVLWSIHDHISSLASNQGASRSPGSGARASNTKGPKVDEVDQKAKSPTVHARGVFQGHEDTVEDVQFCPSRLLVLFFFKFLTKKGLSVWHLTPFSFRN